MTDFRIDTTFFFHLKTLKLKRKLGASGAFALLTLWAYATENRPKGMLTGMTSDDIEAVAQWDGVDGDLVACLLQTGFLDQLEDDLFSLHNWEDRNSWAFHSQERSEAAKKAATARWDKRKNADGMRGALRKDAGSNAQPCKEECPSPSPSPSPKHKNPCAKTCANADTFSAFWAAYPKKRSKGAAEKVWSRKRLGNGSFDLLMTGLERAKASEDWKKDGGKFIPYPATWLNAKGWEDEPTATGQPVADSSRVNFEDLPTSL